MADRVLAFVDLFVDSQRMDEVVSSLKEIKNAVQIYEVTGEFDVIVLVNVASIEEFRDMLKNRIMKIPGIKSTVTSIVLKSHRNHTLDVPD
ncbi:MAG: Lrp/AsnC ligand binding domain-containing protein [Candidatus Thermoplasmatota archaeon]|nr:Lrp/AsnC ligand binding domain-containing protein [Candidatus Thermoplasmatota archaeon]MCL5788869.1 Lrp/AsnC ligand binding domain-containing protein [Candidatus Thermoplasmatota archaeon]